MFDSWGFKEILGLILGITLFLDCLSLFLTRQTDLFFSEIGFLKSVKYRIILFVLIYLLSIPIKFVANAIVLAIQGSPDTIIERMFGDGWSVLNTLLF